LIEEGSIWAKKMHKLLMDMYQKSEKGSQTLENLPYFLQLYDYICKIGEKEEPIAQKSKNGRLKSSKGRNLLNRLKHYQREVTAFALETVLKVFFRKKAFKKCNFVLSKAYITK
jgi:hypothetical protein